MRDRLPLPKGVPRTLRFESVTFKLFSQADGRLAFSYYEGKRRVMVRARTLEALRSEADAIATRILNAETLAKDLTADQRRIAAVAFTELDGTGLHLDAVAKDVAAAVRIVGHRDFSIEALARAHVDRGVELKAPAAPIILNELVAQLRDDKRDEKYIKGLKEVLTRFAGKHRDLRATTANDLRTFARSWTKRNGEPIGPRRRDNIRDALVRLYSFAVDAKYLRPEFSEMAQSVARISEGGEVVTFSPKEIALLLEHVSARWLPWFALAAFAGLRTSEIFRLDWKHIKWDETDEDGEPCAAIAIVRKIARKVRVSRKPPMARNLQDLLQPYRQLVGPICPHESWRTLEDHHQDEIDRLEGVTGLRWHNNVLRHSFGSHRLAIVKDINKVAWEMGNSPAMVRESYNDPKSEIEAKAYFQIRLPDHAKVVTMPLPLTFAH